MAIAIRTAANYLLGKACRRGNTLRPEELRLLLLLAEKRFKDHYMVPPYNLRTRFYKDRYLLTDFSFLLWKIRVFKGAGVIRSSKHKKLIECLDVVFEAYQSRLYKKAI
jgi:hypothetical protein